MKKDVGSFISKVDGETKRNEVIPSFIPRVWIMWGEGGLGGFQASGGFQAGGRRGSIERESSGEREEI